MGSDAAGPSQQHLLIGQAVRRPALRMTPQRLAILDAVRSSHDHPRAADIYDRVRGVLPGIAFGTVYNALHALADHGVILQLSFGDHASRFDGRVDRHDHALCTRCGELVDAVAPPTPEIVEQAAVATGFAIHAYHTQLLGVCAGCRIRSVVPLNATPGERPRS